MSNSALDRLLSALNVRANVFHNGQYCGSWAVDTSGSRQMSFHVVSRGDCYLVTEQGHQPLSTGDAVFFPSDSPHRISGDTDLLTPVNQSDSLSMTVPNIEDATGLVCGNFGHENPLFSLLLSNLEQVIIVKHSPESACSKVIELMLSEARKTDRHQSLLLDKLSDCLLYLLLQNHLTTNPNVFSAMAHPKLGLAFELIHGETDASLSIDQLATCAGMSRSAFTATFKELVGQPPMDYLSLWRMSQAYKWLSEEGISTLDAALRCGYESEASFSKAFKRVMKLGPGEARKQ